LGLFLVDIGKLFIYTPFINSTERNQMSTTIAQTILAQLGGNRFLAMTGAKQLVVLPSGGLQFNFTRSPKNKANKVSIRLDGDLYTVNFFSARGVAVVDRGEFEMIYGDRLAALFTEQTGFDTRL